MTGAVNIGQRHGGHSREYGEVMKLARGDDSGV